MIDGGHKIDFWWFKRVVSGKVDVENENTASVRTVTGTEDNCLPVEY